MPIRKLLFSITKKDLIFQTFRAGGKGGQNQNKTESGVRIIHPASGARAEGREYRDQLSNKRAAFKRLIETPAFKAWHTAECARRLGQDNRTVDEIVDEAMADRNLKIEYL